MSDLSHFLERLIPDAGLRVGSDLIASHEIRGLRFDCLHLDRLDPVLSGNKVFKLLGHLEAWEASGIRVQVVLPDVTDTPMLRVTGNLAPHGLLAPDQVADFICHLLTLPNDTILVHPLLAPCATTEKVN